MHETQEITLDPFERLAETLNKIPNGFPKTADGTHLKVLQWIFTPEEADLASKMKLIGETVEEISERLDIEGLEGLTEKLETMVEKGQIHAMNTSTGRRFGLIPFVVGIYEEQLAKMDSEFARLAEDYFLKAEPGGLFDTEPSIFRVIPINRVIESKLTIYPFESAEQIAQNAKSWGVRECICKKQKSLLNQPCKYPTTVCLIFSQRENAFENSDLTKTISLEESLEHLRKAEEAGLIHCSMNVQTGHSYICNCCTCCCGVLRGLTERNQPLAFVNSNFHLQVDSELCVGCETCVDRCQFYALSVPEDVCQVDLQKCVGCGVCAIVCPEDALSLVARDKTEITKPPDTIRDWMTQKAISRHGNPSDLI